jgi:hypothetical protein
MVRQEIHRPFLLSSDYGGYIVHCLTFCKISGFYIPNRVFESTALAYYCCQVPAKLQGQSSQKNLTNGEKIKKQAYIIEIITFIQHSSITSI